MTVKDLHTFLTEKMSMSEVYQPVIIKHLIKKGGRCSKEDLAARLADNDRSVQEYYQRILMRWPKETLTKHHIVSYDKSTKEFRLLLDSKGDNLETLVQECDTKIEEWLVYKRGLASNLNIRSSTRYQVLKAAKGKCQLCGVPSELSPIDVDHIVPKSRANRYGKVVIDGKPIDVDSIENLQALCFRCNRAKRDGDQTDWRKNKKLVRDGVPAKIRAGGKNPVLKKLQGPALSNALKEKLVEEVAEYLQSGEIEELADISEVVMALVRESGRTMYQLEEVRTGKVRESGGFEEGWYYEGDG
ncbi:MAG: HNH endonuclease [Bacteroidetes bacterium]|nr:HNH endonuclease [Bacteroidota bacterium]